MDMISLRRNLIAGAVLDLAEYTVTGNPVAFTPQLAKPVKSITVPLSYTQTGSGDPYPPGGGKNKFNKNGTITSGEYLNNDGTTTSNGSWAITDYIPIKGNAVTLSGVGGNSPSVCAYDSEKNYLAGAKYNTGSWDAKGNVTITSETEIAYVRLSVYTAVPEYVNTIQLEVGSSATTYASYSNVRPISGVSGLFCVHAKKNMAKIRGYSATNRAYNMEGQTSNSYGTTINTIDPEDSVVITQSSSTTDYAKNSYRNGYFSIRVDNYSIVPGGRYDISLKITDITSNPLDATLANWNVICPDGTQYTDPTVTGNMLLYKNCLYRDAAGAFRFEIRNCAMSCTVSEFMVTPANTNDGVYEPFDGGKLDVVFPALGKNLCNTSVDNTISFEYSGYSNYTISNGTVHITGNTLFGFKVPVTPLTKYRMSFNKSSDVTIEVFDYAAEPDKIRNGDHTCYYSASGLEGTITVPNGSNWILFAIYTTKTDVTISNIQIELGETITSYESYNNSVYGGTLDLVSGVLTLNWKLFEAKSLTWETTSQSSNGVFICRNIGASRDSSKKLNIVCNQYKTVNHDISISAMDDLSIKGNELEKTRVYIRNSNYTDVNSFAATLNDVYFACELETPITIQLDPHSITAIKGTNTVWTDTTGDLTIKYLDKA